MNRKRNVNFIKPEDPPFLKVLKKQAGYDVTNHKFDKLQNHEEDFVSDDESELPQVVVLKPGDLSAEEAGTEKEKKKKIDSETKADLSKKVVFRAKKNNIKIKEQEKKLKKQTKHNNKKQFLSFSTEEDDC